MRPRWVEAIVLAALVVSGCTGVGGAGTLEGTQWILTSLNGQVPLPGSTITAAFGDDGKLAGSSGCNAYSAAYQVSGSSLTIGQAVSTLMACDEPLMQQESDYLAALTTASRFAIEGDRLTIEESSGAAVLVFAAQSNELAGTSWIVTGYNNGQGGVVSVMAGTELTAAFGADGQVAGNAGCNSYNASYTTDDDSITIGPAASTRMFCPEPEGVMDQEAQYLAALTTAATYSIRGTSLELRAADGALAADFQKATP